MDVWPIHSPRMVSTIGVNGWCAANPRSHPGIVAAGTNAVLTYGMNMSTNVTELAASALCASRPTAAASQDSARMNSTIIPAAPAQPATEASGRQPTARPTPITSAVAIRLRSRLAVMCPTSTEEPLIGMDRNRSTMPLLMSVATATAVVPAPKPAHSTIRPGTT